MESSPVCKKCKKLTIGIQNGVCAVCRSKPWNPSEKKEEKGKGYPNAYGGYFSKQQSGPKQHKQEHKPDPNAICRHFLEGKCKFGDNCRYFHGAFKVKENDGNVSTYIPNSNPSTIPQPIPVHKMDQGDGGQDGMKPAQNFNSKTACVFFIKG